MDCCMRIPTDCYTDLPGAVNEIEYAEPFPTFFPTLESRTLILGKPALDPRTHGALAELSNAISLCLGPQGALKNFVWIGPEPLG